MLAANAAHHSVVLVGCHRQDNSREHMNNRRSIFRSALALMAAMICFDVTPALANGPALQRITMATFTSADLAGVERDYARWLGYQVRERGVVSPELAKAWGRIGLPGFRIRQDGRPHSFQIASNVFAIVFKNLHNSAHIGGRGVTGDQALNQLFDHKRRSVVVIKKGVQRCLETCNAICASRNHHV